MVANAPLVNEGRMSALKKQTETVYEYTPLVSYLQPGGCNYVILGRDDFVRPASAPPLRVQELDQVGLAPFSLFSPNSTNHAITSLSVASPLNKSKYEYGRWKRLNGQGRRSASDSIRSRALRRLNKHTPHRFSFFPASFAQTSSCSIGAAMPSLLHSVHVIIARLSVTAARRFWCYCLLGVCRQYYAESGCFANNPYPDLSAGLGEMEISLRL